MTADEKLGEEFTKVQHKFSVKKRKKLNDITTIIHADLAVSIFPREGEMTSSRFKDVILLNEKGWLLVLEPERHVQLARFPLMGEIRSNKEKMLVKSDYLHFFITFEKI